MMQDNTAILEKANRALRSGDTEGFLEYCTGDTTWHFIGDRILRGKSAVRDWAKEAYREPPDFTATQLIAAGDFVTAIGTIRIRNEAGVKETFTYCDVWRFRDGKMTALQAFVVPTPEEQLAWGE